MPTSLEQRDIRELAAYLSGASGIELDDSKAYLLDARLRGLATSLGCSTLGGLLEKARRDSTGRVRDALIDAVATNETSFFREAAHFQLLLQKLIPDHFEKRDTNRLRIWCAAASTGQEAYSVAITLKELLGSLSRYRIQIVGTDISSTALERASRGVYTSLEVSRGLNRERTERYFTPRGRDWAISDELRGLATFQRLNLLEPAPTLGSFDIVLCRNVSIYFAVENRKKLFANVAARIPPGGVLLVSMTESLGARTEHFERCERHGVFYYERV